jgi:hypothetical protein
MMKTLLWSLVAALQIALGSSSYYGGYSSYSSSSSSSSSASYTYNGDAYGNNFFADTDVSYYDGYQQSWRYLGWYVKCGSPSGRYDEEDSHENSHDSGDDNTRYSGNNWCQRYLIWASVRTTSRNRSDFAFLLILSHHLIALLLFCLVRG